MLHYPFDIIRVCSEILFSEGFCGIEASNLICGANWLNVFCIERSFTGECYQADRNCGCLFLFFVMYVFLGKLEICKIIL